MKEKYQDKKVLIGRDKLDYIKGVPHKLLAFELFLKTYSEFRGKVRKKKKDEKKIMKDKKRKEQKRKEKKKDSWKTRKIKKKRRRK